ncbi:MAG TPA: protoporphyrinogen oxidase [Streptosporangiaceae bacterium]|nr:protoporphyrinogen oxidase [Streptosporangiaceae bacterium]
MTEIGPDRRSVAVIGGGVSGLSAAFLLRSAGFEVTVLEGSPRLGGKLAVSEVGGAAVDSGAEALLARRPEGTGLIGELGLAGQLEVPGTTSAGIWTRGSIRSLPRRQFMGVPADIGELAGTGILSEAGLARAAQEASLPAGEPVADVSVTSMVGGRFGTELVDRLVEPLLGGVYAGRCEDLSFSATLPALAEAARGHSSLTEAAASLIPSPGGGARSDQAQQPDPAQLPGQAQLPDERPRPVFTTLTGGLGTLPEALAAASGAVIRTSAMVRELVRTQAGWRLTVGSAHAPETVDADAVIIAVPAIPASRLLAGVADSAAAALGEIRYASMAIVTLAYPVTAFPEAVTGSGFLVPAVDGRTIKAVTFSTVKWPHLRATQPDLHIVRCSVGRLGEDTVLQRDDTELAALAAADLADATGVRGRPADIRVSRWGGGLPQYSVGHLDRVAKIRAGIATQPGLAICGAAYDGVGIPACIGTARLAVERVLAYFHSQAKPA